MVKVEKGKPRERTIINPEGEFETVMEIPFKVRGAEYTVTMPVDEFTPEAADARVREKAEKVAKYAESEIEV